MEAKIKKELKYVGDIIRKIREPYKKEKCTAREIEVMLYIYTNPNQSNFEVHIGTGLLESITSKYVKNLFDNNLVEKNGSISPTTKLIQLLTDAIEQNDDNKFEITLKQLFVFIRKFREIYDEQKCTAREIEVIMYIYNNPEKYIVEIVKATNINQSVVSKYVIKLENLKFVVKQDNKITTTKKLNSLLELVMSEALKK